MSCLRECHAINSYYEYSSINVRNFNCKGRLMTIYSQIYFLEYTEYYHATKINPFQFFSTNDIFTCITVCKSSCNRLIIGKLKQKRPTAFGYSFKLSGQSWPSKFLLVCFALTKFKNISLSLTL